MVGSSILPVAIHKNKLYFLFGKENRLEDSAKGFSDFGGGIEKGENRIDTAMREGSEELSGFLGDAANVRKRIRRNGGVLHLCHNENYHVHIFCTEYDPNLPVYFTNQHHFLWKRMNPKMLNSTKLFEKQEIRWFSVDELKTKRNEFRSFYREIVDMLLEKMPLIRKFCMNKRKTVKKSAKLHSNTKKMRGGGCGCSSELPFASLRAGQGFAKVVSE